MWWWRRGCRRRPLGIHRIGYAFRKAATDAGLKGVSFHDLHRKFRSRASWAGCSPEVAEHLMDHRQPEVVRRYLVHDLTNLVQGLRKMEKQRQIRVTPSAHSPGQAASESVPETVQASPQVVDGKGEAEGVGFLLPRRFHSSSEAGRPRFPVHRTRSGRVVLACCWSKPSRTNPAPASRGGRFGQKRASFQIPLCSCPPHISAGVIGRCSLLLAPSPSSFRRRGEGSGGGGGI